MEIFGRDRMSKTRTLTRRRTLRPDPASVLAADIQRDLKQLQQQPNPDPDRLGALMAIADEVF
jgi:hypothetical protein